MNLFPIAGERLDPTSWHLEPADVLFDFDGPEIFTAHLPSLGLALVYLCVSDKVQRRERYLVVAIEAATVDALAASRVSVREVLDQPFCWVVDATFSGDVEAVHRVAREALPDDALPRPGVAIDGRSLTSPDGLWAELQRLPRRSMALQLRDPTWKAEAA
ncbi:MAG: hypothetical protein R3F65_20530 [bacterium]